MYKKIKAVMLCLMFVPVAQTVHAKEHMREERSNKYVSAKLNITSDYVFRGIPQGGNSVQGGLHVKHPDVGLFADLWAANNPSVSGPEGRFSLGYKLKDEENDLAYWLKATHYEFIRKSGFNMNEYSLGMSWKKRLFLMVDYADEWRQLGDSNLHVKLKGKFNIGHNLKLLLNVGETFVDDKNTFGYDDYLNYGAGVGVYHDDLFYALEWSDTDREFESAGVKTDAKDQSIRFSLSKHI